MSKEIKIGVKIEGTHLTPLEGVIRKTVGVDKHGYTRYRYYYLCKCDCGSIMLFRRDGLVSGDTTRCSKCHDCDPRRLDPDIRKHYLLAKNIRKRCRDALHTPSFYGYGGRGIECNLGESILDIAENIKKIPGYFKGAQLDRIDNEGNYTIWHNEHGFRAWVYHDPVLDKDFLAMGNLRWVTNEENSNNRFINHKVDFEMISNRLLTKHMLTMICNLEKYKPEDFSVVKFPLKSKDNRGDLCLFIHKTLIDTLEDKVIRILNLYNKYGNFITVTYNGVEYTPTIDQDEKEEIEIHDSEEEQIIDV